MQDDSRVRSRRRLQFSLRSLLVVVTLAAVALALGRWKYLQARKQRELVEAVHQMQGYVDYRYDGPQWLSDWLGIDVVAQPAEVSFWEGGPPEGITAEHLETIARLESLDTIDIFDAVVAEEAWDRLASLKRLKTLMLNRVWLPDHPMNKTIPPSLSGLQTLNHVENLALVEMGITDEYLAACRLSEWKNLRKLYLGANPITDDGLRHLRGCDRLEVLHLTYTQVRGTGLKHLRSLPNLHEVSLKWGPTVDEALPELAKLENLRTLSLQGSKVTDQGISHLCRLQRLERLNLDGAKGITDAALPKLAALPVLRHLDLRNTNCTPQGVKKLQQRRPECKILR